MQATSAGTGHDTAVSELDGLVDSWLRHLRAERKSPATLQTHDASVRQLARFLAEQGMPTSPPRRDGQLPHHHARRLCIAKTDIWAST